MCSVNVFLLHIATSNNGCHIALYVRICFGDNFLFDDVDTIDLDYAQGMLLLFVLGLRSVSICQLLLVLLDDWVVNVM